MGSPEFLYRPVAGGLDDAMRQVYIFTDKSELVRHLRNITESWMDEFNDSDVYSEYLTYDTRIDWDTYYVRIKSKSGKHDIVGYTNVDIDGI